MNTHRETADVCVIGSGAGGAVVAKELAEAGLSVVILEAGEHHEPRTFTEYEPDMLRRLFWDSGLRRTRDGAIVISQGRGVGGSTVHNLCYAVRPPQPLLNSWGDSWGDNWGIPNLSSAIARVEETLNVTQIEESEVNRLNAVIRRGCEAMGWRGTVQRHNRGQCAECGARCLFGCPNSTSMEPVGALSKRATGKQSMDVTYIPLALAAGARLYSNCLAESVLVEKGKAVGVAAHVPTAQLTIRSKAVVLAAGAINSPQLWLKSGLPNVNPQVGRNLHLHPAVFVGGIFDEIIDGHLGIPQSFYIDEFLDSVGDLEDARSQSAPTSYTERWRGTGPHPTVADSGYLLMPAFGSQMIVAASLPGFGKSHRELMERYRHIAALLVLLHDKTSGRVSLNRDGTPRITYRLNREDKTVLVEGAINAARLLFAAGAREILMPYTQRVRIQTEADLEIIRRRGIVPNDVMLASSHPQGTLRMGENPETSVVTLSGEARAVRNLFVTDASLFPSSIGVPPTLTIAALADAIAHQIVKKL